jgi:hypothetical protein
MLAVIQENWDHISATISGTLLTYFVSTTVSPVRNITQPLALVTLFFYANVSTTLAKFSNTWWVILAARH